MAKWSALSSPISIFVNVCDMLQILHYRHYMFRVQWAAEQALERGTSSSSRQAAQ
jgi:hypothetical protein